MLLVGLSTVILFSSDIRLREKLGHRFEWAIMLIICLFIAILAYLAVRGNPIYGTDEMAFDQYAAQLLVHGSNPYTNTLRPAFQLFHVPANYTTNTLQGGIVDRLSYPSLSFLIYIPFILLGLTQYTAIIVDVLAWIVSMLLLFRFLPRNIRYIPALLVMSISYTGFVYGGVTDVLELPFLILTLVLWEKPPKDIYGYIGPIALGLACAIKQTPWILAVFLLISLIRENRPIIKWLTFVGVGFFVPNIPFIIMSPMPWLRGVILPVFAPIVPNGQGLITMALFHGTGGQLSAYEFPLILALVAAAILYWIYYGYLKRAIIGIISLLFYFPTRSFISYMTMLLPLIYIGIVYMSPIEDPEYFADHLLARGTSGKNSVQSPGRTIIKHPDPTRRTTLSKKARLGVVGSLGALLLGATAFALVQPDPISIKVISYATTGQLQTVASIKIRVDNLSNKTLIPSFTILDGASESNFWHPNNENQKIVLKPHKSRILELYPPNVASMPGLAGWFRVVGLTDVSEKSISESSVQHLSPYGLQINPVVIDHPVHIGGHIVFHIQLVNTFNDPMPISGVPVYGAEVIYGETFFKLATEDLTGATRATGSVMAYTNNHGIATITFTAVVPSQLPVWFQTWIRYPDRPPEGYSSPVMIRVRS